MQPLDNEHIDCLDDDMMEDSKFKGRYVEQISAARDSILNVMCKAVNVTDTDDLRYANLNKRNICKDQLCVWLETVVCILDKYAMPVMFQASQLEDDLDTLKNEKIADQKIIIDLQGKLIENKNEELKAVTTTVQSEMISYSSTLKKSCAEALAPKKLKTALKKAADEEDRSKNLMIYGVKEEESEILADKVHAILNHLHEKPRITNCRRVGKGTHGTVKPVKFSLSSSHIVQEILKKTKELRDVEGMNSIYICPDRTFENRLAYKKLVEELKVKRAKEPDKVHLIRNNAIVSTEKDS